MMRRTILPIVALFAVSLTAAEIPVGPPVHGEAPDAGHLAALAHEIPVAIPVYGEASGYKSSARVASDGDGYLAVWLDDRSGFWSLIATRLTSSGEVLDERGIALVRASYAQGSPKVVWSGTSYVVFWTSVTSSGIAIYSVMSARVDREGRVGAPVSSRRTHASAQ